MEMTVGEAKVLVVGAGGIGCELLKNLALTGFRHIEVVDLDVIELSNLNRQFLFRRHHIGHSKAQVAAATVAKMAPDIHIVAHCANIKDTRLFPLSLFARFDMVMNALDNLDARRYVNNICLAAQLPLIESGTAGYLGQTTVILPRESECFDCTAKEKPKTYPVCTIRTTPSAPIHCIVWAKEYLLTNLFGPALEEDVGATEVAAAEGDETMLASLKRETEAFRHLRQMAESGDADYVQKVYDKVFVADIEALLDLKDLWETRSPPQSLPCRLCELSAHEPGFDRAAADEQQIWPLDQWRLLFQQSAERLRKRAFTRVDAPQDIYFDKDDEDTMDLVSAAANIRAHIFSIPLASRFSLKSMAGNIIPAIATTNAIVAGKMTLQALNLLKSHKDVLCNSFVTYGVRRGMLFARERLSPPSPTCSVCQVDRARVLVDVQHVTLASLMDKILREYGRQMGGLAIDREDVTVIEGARILYDIDMVGNEGKTLAALDCGESKFVKFDFLHSDVPLLVAIQHGEDDLCTISFDLLPTEQRNKRQHARMEGEQKDQDTLSPPPAKQMKLETKFDQRPSPLLVDDVEEVEVE